MLNWISKFVRVRKAKDISEFERQTCERYGENVIGTMLAGGFTPSTDDLKALFLSEDTRQHARDWLTERNDFRDRRDRWTSLRDFVLEIAVIALIGWEIRLAIQQGVQQSENFDRQQQVLTNLQRSSETSVRSLDSAVQSLNRLTTTTDQQAKKLEDYQKQALAKPDFALDFMVVPPTTKTVRKLKLQTILEYKLPHGRNFFLMPAIRNVSSIPAHNVRIFWGIGPRDWLDSIEFVPPQPQPMVEVPSSIPGWRLFEQDQAVLYPGDWNVAINVAIKADAPMIQMALSIEGSDLTHRYQQWATFSKQEAATGH